MIGLLTDLSTVSGAANISVEPFLALVARLSGVFLLLPGIGMRIIPVRVRIGVVLSLAVLLFPAHGGHYVEAGTDHIAPLLIGELLVGSFYGLSARLFLFALGIAGAVIAQSLSLSQIFGTGVTEEANTTISTLLTTGGAALFLSLQLHLHVIDILVGSLTVFPPGSSIIPDSLGAMTESIAQFGAQAISLAIVLSLPFLLMNLAFYTLLGVLNRAMPQLMVTFVGLPAITLSGFLLLMMTVGPLMVRWADQVTQRLEMLGS